MKSTAQEILESTLAKANFGQQVLDLAKEAGLLKVKKRAKWGSKKKGKKIEKETEKPHKKKFNKKKAHKALTDTLSDES